MAPSSLWNCLGTVFIPVYVCIFFLQRKKSLSGVFLFPDQISPRMDPYTSHKFSCRILDTTSVLSQTRQEQLGAAWSLEFLVSYDINLVSQTLNVLKLQLKQTTFFLKKNENLGQVFTAVFLSIGKVSSYLSLISKASEVNLSPSGFQKEIQITDRHLTIPNLYKINLKK